MVRFYNKRRRPEQGIKEARQPVKMTWLRCHRFRSNEVRPWLRVGSVSSASRFSGTPFCYRPSVRETASGLP